MVYRNLELTNPCLHLSVPRSFTTNIPLQPFHFLFFVKEKSYLGIEILVVIKCHVIVFSYLFYYNSGRPFHTGFSMSSLSRIFSFICTRATHWVDR